MMSTFSKLRSSQSKPQPFVYLFVELHKLILKFIWNYKIPKRGKILLLKDMIR